MTSLSTNHIPGDKYAAVHWTEPDPNIKEPEKQPEFEDIIAMSWVDLEEKSIYYPPAGTSDSTILQMCKSLQCPDTATWRKFPLKR